ncbi:MAG: AzlD domain-containing protein [Clostridia bacterium]|nr:AzlD domain-containing protein [Clostridia bacterium]
MPDIHSVLLVGVIALVTVGLRFLPFAVFSGKNKTPRFIIYLGTVLPFAVMGMLVIYCLRNISFLSLPFGLPELISVLAVVLLHLWKKNTLISIISGTACYILLVQLVF